MLGERNTEGFKSDREKTSQVNHSSSKEKNTNDKVNNTPGHHYPIDDIYTKTLIAPKSFQMMNLNKYIFRTTRKML